MGIVIPQKPLSAAYLIVWRSAAEICQNILTLVFEPNENILLLPIDLYGILFLNLNILNLGLIQFLEPQMISA